MSFIYSRALVEEYSRAKCSDTDVFAPLSGNPTPKPCLWHDKTMEVSPHSRYGMTCRPLTEDRGADVLTWWLAAFPVKPIPQQLRAAALRTTSGRKCDGSWQMSLPGTYLPRTSADDQLTRRQTTLNQWVTKPDVFPYPRQTWVVTTYENGIGYLHTPTCAANYSAPSMQKHACARAFSRVFGRPSPINHEWLMGWPIGWSDLRPLEMGKYQSWLQQHGVCLEASK